MTQNREELEGRIAAFIDGELSPDESARLEVFLANTDPALADQVLSMLADKHSLHQLPRTPAPSDLSSRIMDAVERTSLLHEVETFSVPKRPWWQSRAAIAASLLLVLTGFTYVVIQSTLRSENGFHEFAENNQPKSPFAPLAKREATADQLPLADDAKNKSDLGTLAAAGSSAKSALSESASLPPAATFDEQVLRNKAAAQVPAEIALKNGFAPASNALAALDNVKASPANFSSGTPVILSLVARDSADPQRLQSMLQQMLRQDPAASSQQLAFTSRAGNSPADSAPSAPSATAAPAIEGASKKAPGGTAAFDYNVYNNSNRQFEVQTNSLNVASADKDKNLDNEDHRTPSADLKAAAEQAGGAAPSSPGSQQFAQSQSQAQSPTPASASTLKYAEKQSPQQIAQQQSDFYRYRAGTSSNPYRVVLRADQLTQITDNFQVQAITRGTAAYLVNSDRADNTTNYDSLRRYENNYKSAKGTGLNSKADASASARSVNAETQKSLNAADALNTRGQSKDETDGGKQRDHAAATAPIENDQWLECVITMEPSAAPLIRLNSSPRNSLNETMEQRAK